MAALVVSKYLKKELFSELLDKLFSSHATNSFSFFFLLFGLLFLGFFLRGPFRLHYKRLYRPYARADRVLLYLPVAEAN